MVLAGVGDLGSLEHLPPTFSLLYEFDTKSPWVPYVSAGVNITWIIKDRLEVAGIDLDLDSVSIGAALGAGFAYRINDRWDFDASVKWISLDSNVKAMGNTLTQASLDPWLYSLGFGYRF